MVQSRDTHTWLSGMTQCYHTSPPRCAASRRESGCSAAVRPHLHSTYAIARYLSQTVQVTVSPSQAVHAGLAMVGGLQWYADNNNWGWLVLGPSRGRPLAPSCQQLVVCWARLGFNAVKVGGLQRGQSCCTGCGLQCIPYAACQQAQHPALHRMPSHAVSLGWCLCDPIPATHAKACDWDRNMDRLYLIGGFQRVKTCTKTQQSKQTCSRPLWRQCTHACMRCMHCVHWPPGPPCSRGWRGCAPTPRAAGSSQHLIQAKMN